MKRILLIAATVLVSLSAHAGDKKQAKDIEAYIDSPSKPFSAISPLSASKGDMEDAFDQLKKKAAKMGADAIINWKCTAPTRFNEGLAKLQMSGVSATCSGTAIKWTEPATAAK